MDNGDDGQHGAGLGKNNTGARRMHPEQGNGAGAGAEAEQADQQHSVRPGDAQFAEAVGDMPVVADIKGLPVF